MQQVIKLWEIAIVRTEAARELPNPFNRVQFRAVGRKKVEPQSIAMFSEPWPQLFGMMPAGVINDDNHFSSFSAMAYELRQKTLERLSIKRFLQTRNKPPIVYTNSTKDTDAFACRCMQDNRINSFWRYPHDVSRSVLLEVAFIFRPDINIISCC